MVILAIEAAVCGGSVALLSGGSVVGSWHSPGQVSHSDELIVRLAEIFDRSGVSKREVTRVAVSNGPGSYTGLRIGLATARGFATAFRVPCVGVSTLRAMAIDEESADPKICVVPLGRGGFCWQRYESSSSRLPATGTLSELAKEINEAPEATVIAHEQAFTQLAEFALPVTALINSGLDLAAKIGIASDTGDDGLEPFYARDSSIRPSHQS